MGSGHVLSNERTVRTKVGFIKTLFGDSSEAMERVDLSELQFVKVELGFQMRNSITKRFVLLAGLCATFPGSRDNLGVPRVLNRHGDRCQVWDLWLVKSSAGTLKEIAWFRCQEKSRPNCLGKRGTVVCFGCGRPERVRYSREGSQNQGHSATERRSGNACELQEDNGGHGSN
ncbi:MAG: hypothetical protein GY696_38065, partial [Gammaproteobacteria bacterium]|nr:hypothetical protein [Gammaproteobacteria bacterium]